MLPSRTPNRGEASAHGYRLRIPRGPVIEADDPLLAAYGAAVCWVDDDDECEDALQADAFAPGRTITFGDDPTYPGAYAAWCADEILCAGSLPQGVGAVARAAAEAGLGSRAVVLSELRDGKDHRRSRIEIFVHAPALVRVGARRPALRSFDRSPARPRLVLVVDNHGPFRWWDPSSSAGPRVADELGLSEDLRRRFAELTAAYSDAAPESDRDFESSWERDALDARAGQLWRAARTELSRRYVVGYLGPGMKAPAWTPGGSCATDDDIPF